MYQSPFAKFFNILSFLAVIIGVIAFFINPVITIFCGVISIMNSIIQVVMADQNNLNTEIATIIVAVIIALIFDLSIINIVSFALCAIELLMTVLGWIFMFISM